MLARVTIDVDAGSISAQSFMVQKHVSMCSQQVSLDRGDAPGTMLCISSFAEKKA